MGRVHCAHSKTRYDYGTEICDVCGLSWVSTLEEFNLGTWHSHVPESKMGCLHSSVLHDVETMIDVCHQCGETRKFGEFWADATPRS